MMSRQQAGQAPLFKELINAAKQMIGGNVIVEVEGVEQGGLCYLLTSHHRENLARSMGDQSIIFITPQQECFSTESAEVGRSTPAAGERSQFPSLAGITRHLAHQRGGQTRCQEYAT